MLFSQYHHHSNLNHVCTNTLHPMICHSSTTHSLLHNSPLPPLHLLHHLHHQPSLCRHYHSSSASVTRPAASTQHTPPLRPRPRPWQLFSLRAALFTYTTVPGLAQRHLSAHMEHYTIYQTLGFCDIFSDYLSSLTSLEYLREFFLYLRPKPSRVMKKKRLPQAVRLSQRRLNLVSDVPLFSFVCTLFLASEVSINPRNSCTVLSYPRQVPLTPGTAFISHIIISSWDSLYIFHIFFFLSSLHFSPSSQLPTPSLSFLLFLFLPFFSFLATSNGLFTLSSFLSAPLPIALCSFLPFYSPFSPFFLPATANISFVSSLLLYRSPLPFFLSAHVPLYSFSSFLSVA